MEENLNNFIPEYNGITSELEISFPGFQEPFQMVEYSFERRPVTPTRDRSPFRDEWDWIPVDPSDETNYHPRASKSILKKAPEEKRETYLATLSTKNIVKNYGNAIASFSTSKLAVPYIEEYLRTSKITVDDFQAFISAKKSSLCNMNNFRVLLQENSNDSELVKLHKMTFRKMGEVFIKYFSVNWIFNSRLKHREAHLKYRFKMLRRILKPELFTYLNEKVRS
jgi:hypothetical protein